MTGGNSYVHFKPTAAMEGKQSIDLVKGFTVVLHILLNHRNEDGQQTVLLLYNNKWEIAEFFVTKNAELIFGAGDAVAVVRPPDSALCFDKLIKVILTCKVTTGRVKIEIEIDDNIKASAEGLIADEISVNRMVIGGGTAEFYLGHLLKFDGVMDHENRTEFRELLQKLWQEREDSKTT